MMALVRTAGAGSAAPRIGDLEERAFRKIAARLIPFLFICYLAAYLDRVNVGFAKLQMQQALAFSETVYGFGAGVFFLGYVLFEVPSNLILSKVGARLWIARIMLTWALISAAMGFARSAESFYVLRFLLGAAEAGFIPGVLLYLTYWFPLSRRGRVTALFLAAIPMASIVGGPLSGWILASLSGAQGISGWRWLFLIEALPSLILGVVTLFYLDDAPGRAAWLDPAEKRAVGAVMAAERHETESLSELRHAFTDGRVWLLGAVYFCVASGIYVVSFWLPTLIKRAGVADPMQIGLLIAVPYLAAIVAMILVGARADRTGRRRALTFAPCLVTAAGLALTAFGGVDLGLTLAGLTLAAAGASTAQAVFWTMPASFLGGVAAAAGVALVNSLGNIGGFAGSFVVGWMSDLIHSPAASLVLFAAVLVAGALLTLAVPASLVDK